MMDLDYWDNRYKNHETGWDIGRISDPLKAYFDQLENRACSILIPGAGNAYEAEYLHNLGFNNVEIIDISQTALKNFSLRCPDFPTDNLRLGDFFELEGQYDLIIEQTFFCAINPSFRFAYAEQMHKLLKADGKLVGLFFDREFDGGPPFAGSKNEYLSLFSKFFKDTAFAECYNSIAPRAGSELFAIISNKK